MLTCKGLSGTRLCSRNLCSALPRCKLLICKSVLTEQQWIEKRKTRVIQEMVETSKRLGPKYTQESIVEGLAKLDTLLPGFFPNLDQMKASTWAELVVDTAAIAEKIIVLKIHYPTLNLAGVLSKYPQLLLLTKEEVNKYSEQVCKLLATSKNLEAILEAVPSLMEPPNLISAIVTIRKWYNNKKDPIEILDRDPEIVKRAAVNGVPFEPVYVDANGDWMAPSYNYAEKRADWQAYLDKTAHKNREKF